MHWWEQLVEQSYFKRTSAQYHLSENCSYPFDFYNSERMGRERNLYQGGGQRSKRREEGLYQRGTDINISRTGTELSIHKM